MATALQITADSDFNPTNGLYWTNFGDDWYGIVSAVVDIDDITSSNYDNIAVMTGKSGDGGWFSGIWGLTPATVGTTNTIRCTSSNSLAADWGNYWKMTTYSGVTSYANLNAATKGYYLKSAGYEFVPDTPSVPSGYAFAGWYTEPSFTNQWTSSSRMTADTELYAKYDQITAALDDGTDLEWNSTNSQYETIKYFDANDTFHVIKTIGSASTNYAELDSYMSSDVATSDGSNVTVKVAGTYAIYFKTNDWTIWLELADATQEAYMYAGYFLTTVGCDPNGVNLPSGWSAVAARYANLSGDAKDLFYNSSANESGNTIEQTAARYDHAVSGHAGLTRFMVNKSGTARASGASRLSVVPSVNSSNAIILVAIISSMMLIAVGGFFAYKKKHNK